MEYRIEVIDGRYIIFDKYNTKLGDFGSRLAAEERIKIYKKNDERRQG